MPETALPPSPLSRRRCLAGLAASVAGGLAGWCGAGAWAQAAPEDSADPALLAALAGPQRSAANRARDAARHPLQTLQFFDVQATHTVLELSPGGGWYTEILAPWLRERGRLAVAHFARDDAVDYRRRGRAAFEARLARQPELYDRVLVGTLPGAKGPAQFGELPLAPGSVDRVLTFRNLHNWIEDETAEAILRASFALLRPGGLLGVVDHRAAPGTPLAQQIRSGYLTEVLVSELALAAGFVADGRSEVNANPRDSRDHPGGVWSLPPTLSGREVGREHFLAIGESDRLTHRYRKPG